MIDINKIIKQEPTLTAQGIESRHTAHTNNLPDTKEIEACIEWLTRRKLIPTKSASFNSSCIKVRTEQELKTYASNGAAVAAVIYLGIPYKRIPGSATVEVFLSKKEIFGR